MSRRIVAPSGLAWPVEGLVHALDRAATVARQQARGNELIDHARELGTRRVSEPFAP